MMKQKDKDILIKDLCSRLPYGVKVNVDTQGDFTLIGLTKESIFTACEIEGWNYNFPIEIIKPYLFPLSSMSEEQEEEYLGTCNGYCTYYWTDETFDWLNKNHFDYRNLIDKNLAIDCTNLNIY